MNVNFPGGAWGGAENWPNLLKTDQNSQLRGIFCKWCTIKNHSICYTILHRAMSCKVTHTTAQHRARLSLVLLARSFLLLAAQRVFRGFRPPSGGVFQCKNARARARGSPTCLISDFLPIRHGNSKRVTVASKCDSRDDS